mmetsp:Transcript_526/g.1615  ORF Transcript_526/g.1615 Transcript_526/m.1615 type:complete len:268 (-) Transcript_526:2781-3584(-)
MEKQAEVKAEQSGAASEASRPKSHKELRLEKKAAKKAAAAAAGSGGPATPPPSRAEMRAEKVRLNKERRKQDRKEAEREMIRESRREKRVRKQKRLRREMNAPGGEKARLRKKLKTEQGNGAETKGKKKSIKEEERKEVDMDVFDQVFNGSTDDDTGATILRMGVKCIDVVLGKGPVATDGMLVTVKYKLTGGNFLGTSIDSSKSFNFRLGKGEVIQGWDIGVEGMREGGRRQLIVPPKAGYGSQDIGAGPGATLYFDITLLSGRGR